MQVPAPTVLLLHAGVATGDYASGAMRVGMQAVAYVMS